jgi:hypothetical protein
MDVSITAIDDLAATLLLSNYASARPDLVALYERAKGRQWNGTTDLPWETPVEARGDIMDERRASLYGSAIYEAMKPAQRSDYRARETAWVLSQFMHGEQASLLACGQLMAALPDMDAKFYAASQGYDEARHTEVYRRYLSEKLGRIYPMDANLRFICDTALGSPDWTMKLVAIQLIIESLALGAFKTLLDSARDPLLVQLLTSVMQDEARHVAFGRLALDAAIFECTPQERADYEDFVLACSEVMYFGFYPEDVFTELELNDEDALRAAVNGSEQRQAFRRDLFSVLVPNARAVGLLTSRVEARYRELGILDFAE